MATKRKRPKIKVAPYDSAGYLHTEEDIENYLEAVFEEPMDRQLLIHARRCRASARHDEAFKGHPASPGRVYTRHSHRKAIQVLKRWRKLSVPLVCGLARRPPDTDAAARQANPTACLLAVLR
jgi:hypothetical protein